jgi:hypothetical protein
MEMPVNKTKVTAFRGKYQIQCKIIILSSIMEQGSYDN